MTQNSTIGIPKSSIALNGANANITSMTGLTGSLKSPTAVLDSNGNNVVTFAGVGSAVNYITVSNNSTGNNPILGVDGSDTNIGITLQARGASQVLLVAPSTTSVLRFQPNSNTNSFGYTFSVPTLSTNQTIAIADLSGTLPVTQAGTAFTAHAGGGQGSATLIPNIVSICTVCATNGDSAILPPAPFAIPYYIRNNGAASMNLFPVSGAQINALGANNPLAIAPQTAVIIIPFSNSQAYTFSVS